MRIFQIRVKVSNPSSRERSLEDDFWVDTGALYSFVPRDRLEGIGIKPAGKRRLVLADGRAETMKIGEAAFHCETFAARVVFV